MFSRLILITLVGITLLYADVQLDNSISDIQKVFEKLWKPKGNYGEVQNKLDQVVVESKECSRKKSVIALMLYLEDKKYKALFEENKPKKLNKFSLVVDLLLKQYTPNSEEAYLQILEIVKTYPYDNSLDGFFSHYGNSFTFKKFVRKGYFNVALIVLKYEKKTTDGVSNYKYINNLMTHANRMYSADNIRKKVLKLIVEKADIYEKYGDNKYALTVIDSIVFNLRDEDNLDEYLMILEAKAQKLSYDYKYWKYSEQDKRIFNGLVQFLGENHFFIKSFPIKMREFYFKNISKNKKIKIIPIDNQKLRNTHWVESRCHTETRFDNNGNAHHSYFKESYHFALDNKIYISEDNYDDSECKLKQDNYTHQYYREYKEIETLGKSSDLYKIRLDAFYGDAKSFSDFKHKDAFFDLREDKLCFSKSIFTKKEQITESDNNGNLFTSHVRGFYIDDNKSDEIDYENCLI